MGRTTSKSQGRRDQVRLGNKPLFEHNQFITKCPSQIPYPLLSQLTIHGGKLYLRMSSHLARSGQNRKALLV